MTLDLKLLDTFSALARHSAERHKVLSENVANADTPDYKAKDVQPFQEFYSDIRARSGGEAVAPPTQQMDVKSITSPNGNNVSLDEQLLHTAEAKGQHDMAMAVYKKTLDLFRMALGKNM